MHVEQVTHLVRCPEEADPHLRAQPGASGVPVRELAG